MNKKWLGVFATLLWLFATLLSISQMTGRVRLVDILTLFFGGFGCGAGIVKMIIDFRKPVIQNK